MATEVILPRVDMDMATGRVSKWLAKEGDSVRAGQPLFEIETDKAAMEIESPASGVLRNILVSEGNTTPVGSAVAWIYAEGEAVTAPAPAAATLKAGQLPAAAAVVAPAPTATAPRDGTLRATPLARRLAREAGIDLATLKGSGPHGRIVAEDVRSAPSHSEPAASVSGVVKPQPPDSVAQAYAEGSYVAVPVDGMRRTIAQRLTQSKQTVPHFYLSATCRVDKLLATRASLNAAAPKSAAGETAWKLSVNDFVIKAMAVALQRVPAANVTWAGDAILHHKASDVGVAVAIDGGLFTPVIRSAENKGLSAISLEMRDLASRARARKLAPAEYQGGTTAISNLGMFGIEEFTAIINPPQATILAVGAVTEEFVPVNGKPDLASRIRCTLSCDHRAVDGAVGAELLQAFRKLVEDPALMLA
jgi:pyruvate dehydrogenase E2 component (dihydrolipoamide acetyltransferase)